MHIPVRQFRFSFILSQTIQCSFFHGNIVRGLLLASLFGKYNTPKSKEHNLPLGLIPVACESGRVSVTKGERYSFGINCVGFDADKLAEQMPLLATRISEIGERHVDSWGNNQPILGGNYTDVELEELPVFSITQNDHEVLQNSSATLEFVTPLKMRSPDELSKKNPILGNQCFPVGYFFKQLWSNINKICTLPSFNELPSVDHIQILDKQFLRIETPLWGNLKTKTNKHKLKKIEGVQGHISFSDIPRPWRVLLWYGQYIHLGGNKAYGCGRYVLHGAEAESYKLRPSVTVVESK